MRYRVLGQLEVVGPKGIDHAAAPRQRIVLAMLLLEANHVVPVDRLVDAVWDENPPPTARGQIQICVSALRRALTAAGITDAIVTTPPGYMLRAPDGELDLQLFDRLVASGRASMAEGKLAKAGELFHEALALWQGEPFAGITSRLVQGAAINLSERHLAVIEDSIDVQLRLGRHHELVGELMVLTAQHPVRERLRAQLMTALYRDGRQAEALDVYRQTRQTFIDELGLEPGRALQDLERAILAGDPALEAPVAAGADPGTSGGNGAAGDSGTFTPPHLLPADIADFTGHEDLLEECRNVLIPSSPARSGAVAIVAITGKGGSGKTTVAVHIAHQLADAFPDGQLYVTLRGAEADPVSPAKVLERFLRALGVSGAAIPEGVEERAETYRDRIAGRRVLVVLDDAGSEEQTLPLIPGVGDSAVVVTSRVRLASLPGAHRVELGVFEDEQAIALLAHVAGAQRVEAEPDAARQLVALCGGLPLALRIAAARLAARPHWTIGRLAFRLADEHRRLDELAYGGVGIRTNISVAYEGLTDDGRRLFRRLGILESPDFAVWVGVPLLDLGQDRAEDILESLVDVQLLDVTRVGLGTARYRFHDLIRVYARERLAEEEPPEARRDALRRVMGAWLYLAREAHRREYGGDYTVLHGDADWWPLPPDLTDDVLAEPLDWYEAERVALVTAVRQSADAGLDELCWDLAISTVTLFEARNYLDDWRETHEIALVATQRADNRRGEAAMLYSLGALSLFERRLDEAADALGRCLDMFTELHDAHGCALAQRNLAYVDRVHGDFDGALVRYREALVGLRIAGDSIGEAHALSNIAQVRIELREYDEADRLLAEALAIARSVGARRVEAQALHRLGESLVHRGDLAAAAEAFHEVLSVVRAVGDTVGEAYALHGLGVVQTRLGQYRDAEPVLIEAHRIAGQTDERLLTAQICLALGELCRAASRFTEATQRLEEARTRFQKIGARPWFALADRILSETRTAAALA